MTIPKIILFLRETPRPPWFILLLFLAPFCLSAQTAEELDAALETQAISAAAAARFVLGSADLLPEELAGAEAQTAAYEMAKSRGWLTGAADGALSLEEAAFLVMSAFNIDGGVMYSLFPGPRYAYREMVYRRLIQGRADPAMSVSGPRLLRIIDRAHSTGAEAAQGGTN